MEESAEFKRFAAHELECGEKLESGSFGTVYLARLSTSATDVAVKRFLRQSDESCVAFTNEVTALQTLNALQHPNIIRMIAIGVHLDSRVIVLELAQTDLLEFTKVFRYAARRHFTGWSAQLCLALMSMHNCGLVHGDLKTENIGVFCQVPINLRAPRPPKHEMVLKLMDFGACVAHGVVPTTWFPGTIRTMAPEAMDKTAPVLRSRDIYSLGIMLWEMIASRSFYGSNSDSWVRRQLELKLVAIPAREPCIPETLYNMLATMTRANPTERPEIATVHSFVATM